MSEPFMGEVVAFGFGFVPRGWAYCDGSAIDTGQNPALFSLISNNFGGDGRRTFCLPNLTGRAPMGYGNGPALTPCSIGQVDGTEEVTLTESQTPSHNHGMNVDNQAQNESEDPTGRFISASENGTDDIYIPESRLESNPPLMNEEFVQKTGGKPHENRQPYQVVNFCISIAGAYPRRH